MKPVRYTEKGHGLHVAVRAAGYRIWSEGDDWFADDADAVQAIIDAYDPLAAARTDALQRLAEHRWRVEESGVTVGGIEMDSSRDARANLIGAVVGAQLAIASGQPIKTVWKDRLGRSADVDAMTMINLGLAVHHFIAACFAREAELTAEIAAMDSVKALEAFDPAARWGK